MDKKLKLLHLNRNIFTIFHGDEDNKETSYPYTICQTPVINIRPEEGNRKHCRTHVVLCKKRT
jgi:hypothetical protein